MTTFIAVRCPHSKRIRLPSAAKRPEEPSATSARIPCVPRAVFSSTITVLSELKKKEPSLESVNMALLRTLNPDDVTVEIGRANPRWLWHAIDHQTGKVLAYVFGCRQDTVYLKLKALLEPFGLTRYYTDKWSAYSRHLDPEQHTTSKR